MTASAIRLLRCPNCRTECDVREGKILFCKGAKAHTFDFARSGYLNLSLSAKSGGGDSPDAIRARSAFLESGYYEPLSNAVNSMLAECRAQTVLDAGCGEGYYTNRMAGEGRTVIGADLSRPGIDHAARQAKQRGLNASFLVAGVFDLPVQSEAFDAVTNLFAPCAEAEYTRILKNGGYLILVGAGEDHLMGLKRVLYDTPYRNPGREDLPEKLTLVRKERLQGSITVEGRDKIEALFSMTPYYFRTSRSDHAKLDAIDSLTTEYDFDIFLYRKDTVR